MKKIIIFIVSVILVSSITSYLIIKNNIQHIIIDPLADTLEIGQVGLTGITTSKWINAKDIEIKDDIDNTKPGKYKEEIYYKGKLIYQADITVVEPKEIK